MRIVAGAYGGRKLIVPRGRDIRPTSDKIRGAVMNMLTARGAIEGAHVLDAFCGTGALGLEALSRGAASCVFMDVEAQSLDIAKENAKALGAAGVFLRKDAAKMGPRPGDIPPATLIFLDPPYGKGLIRPALEEVYKGGWAASGAWVVCECEAKTPLDWPEFVTVRAEKTYGETKIIILELRA